MITIEKAKNMTTVSWVFSRNAMHIMHLGDSTTGSTTNENYVDLPKVLQQRAVNLLTLNRNTR